jgi:DNA-binding response OmpR family regulator
MKKILVVEDYDSLRLLYRDVFAEAGYEVILAASGKEALRQLGRAKPDLVILDIVMPVMDGMKALGRMIRKEGHMPIILNTAYSSSKDDFMSWCPDAYVVKSADLEELKAKIRETLGKTEKPRTPHPKSAFESTPRPIADSRTSNSREATAKKRILLKKLYGVKETRAYFTEHFLNLWK